MEEDNTTLNNRALDDASYRHSLRRQAHVFKGSTARALGTRNTNTPAASAAATTACNALCDWSVYILFAGSSKT
jgi:hypothetical protein